MPEARHRVREAMRAWGEPAERVEAASLIVTELVANALQHTGTRRIRCRLLRSGDGVRICVWNRGRGRLPSPRPPADAEPSGGDAGARGAASWPTAGAARGEGAERAEGLSEHGRGLVLVEALSKRWGTSAALAGRLVWADV
ncbi:ATP-binding protein [uncultured Streptomyces sp.]|uniref:ATP-binding protein n=1 Tax=uncultured Streptomyces sp. TaxID=174707 RepID=UPI00261120FF|nr:ATP-binding protein [uncultured Streptomyces sp.]